MIKVNQLDVGGFDSNFSYLIYDEESRDAAVVDPCGDVDVIRKAILDAGALSPSYILLTHSHGDHTSGISELRKSFDAPVAGHSTSSFPIDIALRDGDTVPLGAGFIECIYSPGHTDDSVIYRLFDDSGIFTGDTLFIDCCGYCNPEKMFTTMQNRIFPLSDTNEVYSGHNYGSVPHRSLGEEKIYNPYLSTGDFDEFCERLKEL